MKSLDERIEIAAQAVYEHDEPGGVPWSSVFPSLKDHYRELAEVALTAVEEN